MRYSIDGQILTDIADAINAKTGGTTALAPGDMADEIDSISGGGVSVEPLSVTANGTYTAPSNKAYSPVTVALASMQFELIGTKTMALEEYTDTSTAQEIDTEINISNTDWAYGLVIITCDSAITTSNEWGMTIQPFGRYTSNNNINKAGIYWQKGSATLSFSAQTANNMDSTAYGVIVAYNKSSVVVQRLCHSTGCPKIRAGNYTITAYGLKSL